MNHGVKFVLGMLAGTLLGGCGPALSPGVTDSAEPESLGTVMGAVGPVGDYTYYVSPTGSDTNPGTLAAPFKTLLHAIKYLSPGNTLYPSHWETWWA